MADFHQFLMIFNGINIGPAYIKGAGGARGWMGGGNNSNKGAR